MCAFACLCVLLASASVIRTEITDGKMFQSEIGDVIQKRVVKLRMGYAVSKSIRSITIFQLSLRFKLTFQNVNIILLDCLTLLISMSAHFAQLLNYLMNFLSINECSISFKQYSTVSVVVVFFFFHFFLSLFFQNKNLFGIYYSV